MRHSVLVMINYDIYYNIIGKLIDLIGKLPIDVNEMNIDVMSLSAHKIYGPVGCGALYIRRKPRVRVEPIQSGGGQERGIRSGTIPTSLVVGFGKACDVAFE